MIRRTQVLSRLRSAWSGWQFKSVWATRHWMSGWFHDLFSILRLASALQPSLSALLISTLGLWWSQPGATVFSRGKSTQHGIVTAGCC